MIRLGLRLAGAGGPVRVASLLLGGALAVAMLGLAWGLPDALYPLYEDPLEPGVWIAPPQRGATVAMSTLMLAPVLMLLIATGRLSSVIRDQRLVSLRLIGVSKARTLLAAAVENASVTLVGALAGLAVFAAGAWAVNTHLPVEQPLTLSALQLAVLVVGVVALAAALALVSARGLALLPTQARRGGLAKPASWWRIVPVVVALSCFGVLVGYGIAGIDVVAVIGSGAAAGLFLAGVATGALGIATAPALVARYSATVLRRSGRPSLTMAGRAIEADPTSATRRVAAVGVGIFAIVIAAGVMNAWESVPQSRYATLNAERGPQEVTVHPMTEDGERSTITKDDVAALAAIPHAEHVVLDYGLQGAECDEETRAGCFESFVGTCQQLEIYMPVTGCSNERAAWIDITDKQLGFTPEQQNRPQAPALMGKWRDLDDVEYTIEPFTVDASGPVIEVDWRHANASRGFLLDAELFIPAPLVTDVDLPPVQSVDVIGPPGREFAAAVGNTASELGLQAPAWSYMDYTTLVSVRTMVGSAGAALVAVIVLIVTLSVLDWLRESRRPRMRLLAIGVPRGVIARTYVVQFGIPLLGALALGGMLGGAGIRAYEVLGSDVESTGTSALPATYWWLVTALVMGVLTAASLAGIAAHERTRASDLRSE